MNTVAVDGTIISQYSYGFRINNNYWWPSKLVKVEHNDLGLNSPNGFKSAWHYTYYDGTGLLKTRELVHNKAGWPGFQANLNPNTAFPSLKTTLDYDTQGRLTDQTYPAGFNNAHTDLNLAYDPCLIQLLPRWF